jgi:hypothetical protein
MAIGPVVSWSIDPFDFAGSLHLRGLHDPAACSAAVKVLCLGLINSVNLLTTVWKTIGRGHGGHHHGMARCYSWSN